MNKSVKENLSQAYQKVGIMGPFAFWVVHVQTHSNFSHIWKMVKFDSVFELLTFANLVHYIHGASIIYLVIIFTLKIGRKKINKF